MRSRAERVEPGGDTVEVVIEDALGLDVDEETVVEVGGGLFNVLMLSSYEERTKDMKNYY